MNSREELLRQLSQATDRVGAWPEWKRIMFERSREAERYLEKRSALTDTKPTRDERAERMK